MGLLAFQSRVFFQFNNLVLKTLAKGSEVNVSLRSCIGNWQGKIAEKDDGDCLILKFIHQGVVALAWYRGRWWIKRSTKMEARVGIEPA